MKTRVTVLALLTTALALGLTARVLDRVIVALGEKLSEAGDA